MDDLKELFFCSLMRFKKTESFFYAECELQMSELVVLQSITGGCRLKDCSCVNLDVPSIQERLQITKPAVSYILNSLEKKCYIRREIDPRDRRKISITATAQGEAAAAQSAQKCEEVWSELLERFGEQDMRRLLELLNRLNNICEELDKR